MADSLEAQPDTRKDLIQLAIPVAERVEILNVRLAACDAQRAPIPDFKGGELTISTGISKPWIREQRRVETSVCFSHFYCHPRSRCRRRNRRRAKHHSEVHLGIFGEVF